MAESRKNNNTKKAKVEDESAEDVLNAQHEKLGAMQSEIEKLNDEATEEILQIEKKYNALRKPYYKKRNDVIREIPDFWLKTFLNHNMMSDLLDEEDQEVFKYLKEVNVEDFDDVKSGFKISFTFDTNPYFKNKTISKSFQYNDEAVLTVVPTKIEWKEGKDLTKRKGGSSKLEGGKRGHEDIDIGSESFFCWFQEDDQDLELGEIIKEDVWPNPGKYYHGLADEDEEGDVEVDDDEAEVEGDEDDGEGEEGGEGEGEGEEEDQ